MTAFEWTSEQKDVLASTARITLVQAGPGSGKTKVFAEIVDRRVAAWGDRSGGLAALSFTNVARTEIEERVSAATVAPHFIGTLDAFFLRFVIGPFGHLAGLPKAGARLIPSPLDQQISQPQAFLSTDDRPPIFQIAATGGTEAEPQFQVRRPHGLPPEPVPSDRWRHVLQTKKSEWRGRGRVTHSDCSYLAACILRGRHGAEVRKMLARRFPVFCIDEFQDTGHFLGRAVLSILAEPTIESVVVGDVDQKIFGFSGVNPSLFDQVQALPGAKKYPLRISQRCSARICEIASELSRSTSKVVPTAGSPIGRAVGMSHDDDGAVKLESLERAFELAKEDGCKDLAVLVRTRIAKARILRLAVRSTPAIESRGVVQLLRAFGAIRERDGRQAVDIAQALLCQILVDNARPTEEELLASGIDPLRLRQHVRQLLLRVIVEKSGETWGEWSIRAKECCAAIAQAFSTTDYKTRLGHAFRVRSKDKPQTLREAETPVSLVWPDFVAATVLTIHEAKGREFDAVLYYVAKPYRIKGVSTCPATAWWAPALASEEREVAFVAATRAKRLLVLAVHQQSWAALDRQRAKFFNLFEDIPTVPCVEIDAGTC